MNQIKVTENSQNEELLNFHDVHEINETEEDEGTEAEPWILENVINVTNLFTEHRQHVKQFIKYKGLISLENHVQELAALNHMLILKLLQHSKMIREVFTNEHIKRILNEQVRMSIDLSLDFTSEDLMQLNLILKQLTNHTQSVYRITTDILLFSNFLTYEKRRTLIGIALLQVLSITLICRLMLMWIFFLQDFKTSQRSNRRCH